MACSSYIGLCLVEKVFGVSSSNHRTLRGAHTLNGIQEASAPSFVFSGSCHDAFS